MADKEERHYSISFLNLIFAISSIVLLVTILMLFIDDYNRQWKKFQAAFRQLEVEKTRAKYQQESSALKENPEYQELRKKMEEATLNLKKRSGELKALEGELTKIKARYDLDQQHYQFAKAEYDAVKYEYEETLAHDPGKAEALKEKFGELAKKLEELRLVTENSKLAIEAQNTKIKEKTSERQELEGEEKSLSKQVNILQRKLEKIDPQKMTFTNRIAQAVRNLPVVDFMNPTYRVEQIVLKDITDDVNFMRVPKVDRCITCHLGILNPDFQDAPQPFRTHPRLDLFVSNDSPHPMEEFGCTSCHGGRGRGTDFNSTAHMTNTEEQKKEWEEKYHWHRFHHWETPMYPLKYVEAGCFKCHSGETVIRGAEKLNLGLNLIEKAGCYGCHIIEKYKDRPKAGPDLTHLASKTSKDWVYHWIKDPPAFRHNTWMPSFFGQSNTNDSQAQMRTDQEIHAIVHYLFEHSTAFSKEKIPFEGDAQKGEELVASLGCFGCHSIEPKPLDHPITRQTLMREHGPNLIGLGTKTSKEWIYHWLKNPKRYHPKTRMPDLRLSDEEAAHITAFLTSMENSDFMKHPMPSVNEEMVDSIVKESLEKTRTVKEAEGQLSQMDLNQKLTFAGQRLIKHYGCYACHDIAGFENEKPIGTELTEEGSKAVDRLDFGFIDIEHINFVWFEEKLKNPRIFDQGRIKPFDEKLKMPNFHFTQEEIEAITTALLGFVKDIPAPSKIKPRTPKNLFIEEGQMLVREFNCQGCHIIEGEGGAIQPTIIEWLMKFQNRSENEAEALTVSFSPPNLVGEGRKVQTEWLFDFLHNPEVIRPWLKVRMPTFSLQEDEINDLVKYFNYLDDQVFPFAEEVGPILSSDESAAAQLLFSDSYFGCGKCHIVGDRLPGGSPENWAPNFALAKKRLKPNWIIDWLKNPQGLLPGTKMPTYFDLQYFDQSGPDDILGGDENRQIQVLRDYILTLREEGQQPQPSQQSSQSP